MKKRAVSGKPQTRAWRCAIYVGIWMILGTPLAAILPAYGVDSFGEGDIAEGEYEGLLEGDIGGAADIISTSHPDSKNWYFNETLEAAWPEFAPGAPGFLWLVDQTPGTEPATETGAFTPDRHLTYIDAPHGTSWLHVAAAGANGQLLPEGRAHFQFNVFREPVSIPSNYNSEADRTIYVPDFTIKPHLYTGDWNDAAWEALPADLGGRPFCAVTALTKDNAMWIINPYWNYGVWSSTDGREWKLENRKIPESGRCYPGVVYRGSIQIFPDSVHPIDSHIHVDEWCYWHSSGHSAAVFNGLQWLLGGYVSYQYIYSFCAPPDCWESVTLRVTRYGSTYDVSYSMDGNSWKTERAPWPARSDAGTAVFQKRLWILGGFHEPETSYADDDVKTVDNERYLNDVWSTRDGITWVCATDNAPWEMRFRHSVLSAEDKLWLIGGQNFREETIGEGEGEGEDPIIFSKDSDAAFNDIWTSSNGVEWEKLPIETPFTRHQPQTALFFDGRIWVFGARTYDPYITETWCLARPEVPAESLAGYRYVINCAPDTIITEKDTFCADREIPLGALAPGTYWIHIAAEDTQGNISATAHESFTMNYFAPLVHSPSHPDHDTEYPRRDIWFNWDDPQKRSIAYYYSFDNEPDTMPTAQSTRVQEPHVLVTCAPIGESYFHVRGEDANGNLSETAHYRVNIRNAQPLVLQSSTHPDENKTYSSNDVAFEWNDPDGLAGAYIYALGRTPISSLSNGTAIAENTISFEDLADGTWYFAVAPKMECGGTGPKSARKVNIYTAAAGDYAPLAKLKVYPSSGYVPLQVAFTNESNFKNMPMFYWALDYGDGTGAAGIDDWRYQYHLYNVAGDYTVTLTVATLAGTHSVTLDNAVHAAETGGSAPYANEGFFEGGGEGTLEGLMEGENEGAAEGATEGEEEGAGTSDGIVSTSHPDPQRWYFNGTLEASWPEFAPEASGFLWLIDRVPNTEPTEENADFTAERQLTYSEAPQGTSWLHLAAADAMGQPLPGGRRDFQFNVFLDSVHVANNFASDGDSSLYSPDLTLDAHLYTGGWSDAVWANLAPEGAPWTPRYDHGAVVKDGAIWVVGGFGGRGAWRSEDGQNWNFVEDVFPEATGYSPCAVLRGDLFCDADKAERRAQAYCYDGTFDYFLCTGQGFAAFDDTLYSLSGYLSYRWKQNKPLEKAEYEGADLAKATTKIICGTTERSESSEGGAGFYSFSITAFASRMHAPLSVFQNGLWMSGGYHQDLYSIQKEGDKATGVYFNDVWRMDQYSHWECVNEHAPWKARANHAAVALDGRIWILGGYTGADPGLSKMDETASSNSKSEEKAHDYLNDIWTSEDGVTWTPFGDSAPWSGRCGHEAVAFDGKLWVLGGKTCAGPVNDVWCLARPEIPVGSVAGFHYILDESPESAPTHGDMFSTTARIPVHLPAAGEHWLHVSAEDTQGNLSAPEHRPFSMAYLAPVVSSPSHPDSNTAYPNRNVEFVWYDPQSISTGYYYYLDKSPNTIISESYYHTEEESITYTNLEKGVYYLHLRGADSSGTLSQTAHFCVRIGNVSPPVIQSPSHPDENTGYPSTDAVFTWDDTNGIESRYAYVLAREESSPMVIEGVITSEKSVTFHDLTDGIWVFNIVCVDTNNNVSVMAHRQIIVATEAATDYPPIAAFSISADQGRVPMPVCFVNESHLQVFPVSSWTLDFGDGESVSGIEPWLFQRHVYQQAGVYTVSLSVTTAAGSDTETKVDAIRVAPADEPYASITADQIRGCPLFNVHFTGDFVLYGQPITSWRLDFGDGTFEAGTTASCSKYHQYVRVGTYSVSLKVTTAAGTYTARQEDYIHVVPRVSPAVDFEVDVRSGRAPFTTTLLNTSDLLTFPLQQWQIDFGDGHVASGNTDFYYAAHTYEESGEYDVSLTITTSGGSDTATKVGYVSVAPTLVPSADFVITPLSGTPPLEVLFTNTSDLREQPLYYARIEFGDGTRIEERSDFDTLAHTYTAPGTYTVSFNVCTNYGYDTETKTEYVRVWQLHSADQNKDSRIDLSELLRAIQFFNLGGLYCAESDIATEDGYNPGIGGDHSCAPHSSDYDPQDWRIDLSELVRLIQLFNTGGYHACADTNTEDGFCPGQAAP